MTIDLDALEALEKKATPGPWVANGMNLENEATGYLIGYISDNNGFPENDANALLLVALRNALPELLRRLREAEKDRQQAMRDGAEGYAELLRDLKNEPPHKTGTDTQAYDHIIRRMQDMHGSYQQQIAKAAHLAATKERA